MPPPVVAVSGNEPDAHVLARASEVLARGGLLIYPTDTLYAIGGRALQAAAVEAVRAAKGRDEGKPLPLIAATVDQARSLCGAWTEAAQLLADRFWPGPLTLVLLAAPGLPPAIGAGTGTVAVRVPALELPRALCRDAGPLVSTSANRAGQPPPLTCEEAVAGVGGAVALALDAGPGRPLPSTIVDLTSGRASLVRAGAVSWAEVEGVLPPHRR